MRLFSLILVLITRHCVPGSFMSLDVAVETAPADELFITLGTLKRPLACMGPVTFATVYINGEKAA
jgi:hypothetical protein